MIATLNNKPVIGLIAGFSSSIFYLVKKLLTDDAVLKVVAGLGIWLGVGVAFLTVILRGIEIYTRFKANKQLNP